MNFPTFQKAWHSQFPAEYTTLHLTHQQHSPKEIPVIIFIKLHVDSSRLEIQNNSFSRLGVKLWNRIPSYIRNLIPKKAFKRVLHKLLFGVLEMEDDYIEISLIIKM